MPASGSLVGGNELAAVKTLARQSKSPTTRQVACRTSLHAYARRKHREHKGLPRPWRSQPSPAFACSKLQRKRITALVSRFAYHCQIVCETSARILVARRRAITKIKPTSREHFVQTRRSDVRTSRRSPNDTGGRRQGPQDGQGLDRRVLRGDDRGRPPRQSSGRITSASF